MPRQRGENMGRGGRGGRSPTPNDDRSRSMNPQDVCGQAARAQQGLDLDYRPWGYEPNGPTARANIQPHHLFLRMNNFYNRGCERIKFII